MEIGSAIAAFSALKDLGAALIGERDRQKAAAIEVEFNKQLIEAQTQLAELLGTVIDQQGRVGALEQRVRDVEAAQAEKERYVLAKVGNQGEFFAYRLRDATELTERVSEVPHLVCQPCFEVGKKIVLTGNGSGYWSCSSCKHGAHTEPSNFSPGSPVRRARVGGY